MCHTKRFLSSIAAIITGIHRSVVIISLSGLSLTGQAVETGSSPPRARVPEAVPVQSSETGSSPPTASPPEAVTARVTEAVPVRSSETAARVPEAVPVQSSETGSSPPTASPPEAVTACVPEAVPFRSSETGSSPPTAPVLDPQFLSAGERTFHLPPAPREQTCKFFMDSLVHLI